MPQWRSNNSSATLSVHSESLTGRFEKSTGQCSYQGTNNLVVYEDHANGVRHVFVSEQLTIGEDERYVYFQTGGRLIEETERIPATRPSVGRRRRRRETSGVNST